jgi:hypothetical protein
MYALNIYGPTGLPRTDIPDSEIAKLSGEQKSVFFAVMSSWSDATEAEAANNAAQSATRRAATALDKSRKKYEDAQPKRTFHDEWRETVARLPAKPVSDAAKKAIAAALVEVEKAEKHLAECHRTGYAAKQDEKDKRAAFAKNVIAWSAMDGIPKNVGDLIKARSATERKIAMDNIAKGLPDYAVQAASTVGDSHLDRFKAGQAKGGSANYGYHLNRMRGATVKVPSER